MTNAGCSPGGLCLPFLVTTVLFVVHSIQTAGQ